MTKKYFLSLIMISGFAITETTVFAKEKKIDFKYKTKHGDVSRAFMSDIIGNTTGYLYDFAKNFKKHPELFLAAVATVVPYFLYQEEVDVKVKNFVNNNKKALAVSWAAAAVVAYAAKDKINEYCFADDEEEVNSVKEKTEDLEEKAE